MYFINLQTVNTGSIQPLLIKMLHVDEDKLKHQNERVLSLIVELNSTLDLYYENNSEKEIVFRDQ